MSSSQKASEKRGASTSKTSWRSRIKMFWHLHKIELISSYQTLLKTPISTLMTIAVLGIAIALPAGLQLMLKNANTLSADWDGATRISLYLKDSVDQEQAMDLRQRLSKRLDVEAAHLIDKDMALEEFQSLSGLGNALEQLPNNPLPQVIEIVPTASFSLPEASQSMLDNLRRLPEVELAKLDMQWVKRLYYLLQLIDRFVYALVAMLGMAVLLIVGNTIRLAIQNRREEIVIIKLIGATNAFIRRPFLYTGVWYGLGGGIFALMLVSGAMLWLAEPVSQLAVQYNSSYFLQGLSFTEAIQLLLLSCLLGLMGAWISVGRHLRQINPT